MVDKTAKREIEQIVAALKPQPAAVTDPSAINRRMTGHLRAAPAARVRL